jgi:hypothetical protein
MTARPTGASSERFAEGSLAAPRFGQGTNAGGSQLIPLDLEAPDPVTQ